METNMPLEEVSQENVLTLSEEAAFNLLHKEIYELPKEKRIYYENLICSAFDFRTVSSKNRTLRGDMSMVGYKFFQIPNENKQMGIRRKRK